MKTLKTIALISIVSVGMSSSVFAAWWNPFSWKVFSKKNGQVAVQQNIATTTPQEEFLTCNGSKYKKCPTGEVFSCPTNAGEAFCEKNNSEEIKTPKTKIAVNQKNETPAKLLATADADANKISRTKTISQPQSKATTPGTEDSTRIYNLYQLLADMADSKIDKIKLNKKYYDSSITAWSDELVRTETYLASFPGDPYLVRDGKVYRAQIASLEANKRAMDNYAQAGLDYKAGVLRRMEEIKNKKLDISAVEKLLSEIEQGKKGLEELEEKSEAYFKQTYEDERNLAVKMDALHSAEKAKRSYDIAISAKQDEEILRLKANIDKNLQGVIDTYNNSKPINCTSKATGIYGQYEISCN